MNTKTFFVFVWKKKVGKKYFVCKGFLISLMDGINIITASFSKASMIMK